MTRLDRAAPHSLLALGVLAVLVGFAAALRAEDPPPGANYGPYNTDLIWEEPANNGGTQIPDKLCQQAAACLANSPFCYSPYNAGWMGVQYQSLRVWQLVGYGTCQPPLPGTGSGGSCTQKAVPCAKVFLQTALNCGGEASPLLTVYHKSACSLGG